MRAKTGLASLALLALTFATARAEPVKIRVAWVAPIANLASIWLEKKDLARNYGKSYLFEAVRYRGTPTMITAIANNELEVGNLAFSTLPIAIENAGMDDIRVISDDFRDGVDDYYSNGFAVRAEGEIRKVEDLKGKIVATNTAGSAVDVSMRAMLRRHGLEDRRDYTVIEAPFPAMSAMLAEKKVDMVPAILPFSLEGEFRKTARILFTGKDAVGVSQFVMWSARKPFIDAHRPALVDFLEDTLRIMRWYLDPKNHDAVAAIAARLTKQPVDRLGWLFTKNDYYRDPDMLPDIDALQRNVDTTKDLGFINASIDVRAHSDLSMIEEAGRRLK